MSDPIEKVNINTRVNYADGLVTFRQQSSSQGLVILNPVEITVPLALLVRIVQQGIELSLPPQIRALDFLPQAVPRPDSPTRSFEAHLSGKGPTRVE